MMNNILDLAPVAAVERLDRLHNSFSALGSKDALMVKSNENLFPYLLEFQDEMPGQMLFFPTQVGPDNWSAMIIKTEENSSLHRSIIAYMSYDHARCDHLYADGEAAALEGIVALAGEVLSAFNLSMNRHLDIEEKILFPAFEEKSGMRGGPTNVMRMEHEQMRGVLKQMKSALEKNDTDTVLGLGETMLILMQQHNMKEEGILYPMIDSQIGSDVEELIREAQRFEMP